MFAAGSHLETGLDSSATPSLSGKSVTSPYTVLPGIKPRSARSSAKGKEEKNWWGNTQRFNPCI